jgi:hypothetical protein
LFGVAAVGYFGDCDGGDDLKVENVVNMNQSENRVLLTSPFSAAL